ncbi:MAG: aminotransferase class I/II-fold pyridoxal phosphate-dependent enzyme [Nitrosopumilaceae archaeon]|nr:DegT/DnrJ/EryC1/StrS aminotransferase family protein [Nitrosopumilaceae archaeon]NIU00837.1 DegT/DnrJ/EryC1/StrS aminotransferase family protein [Nitrosopumilaceae archaeon]NIU87290.1 aminotransferase class I/II-fold pyridoxal phosphate-dependent enzyme [Nitrosopumilaceae archaeon]NIV65818.1 aminotransferase class I/II-fold pyridoxal phosphate-dependent enzyme [Nitrosopumilaceae archaeon]NIX61439.1 aminotransferase class I/II-fold pyridoxal phosphate-dependent enzyme [Nitrosopumilaceae archa
MKIPINIPDIGREEIREVNKVLRSGVLTSASRTGGKFVQEFEKFASKFVRSKHAISVNSGTAAIQSCLYAIDIKKGDEVVIPSFTFVATANAIMATGAKPVFVDILKDNYTIDPFDLEKKITSKTKAIIPVHIYGNVAYIDQIIEIAKKHNLYVIEDAAQSLGSTFKKKHTGTFGDLGCYSLYPAKVMTSGEGGFIVTNNTKLKDKLLMIRNHGMVKGYDTKVLGLNFRLPEINAAIAKVQLNKLPKFLQKRRSNAELLHSLVNDMKIKLPSERSGEKVNWYLYTIATSNRNHVMKKLNDNGIGAVAYYVIPVHKIPFYRKSTRLKVTEWASTHVLSLPVHPQVSKNEIIQIAKKIHEVVN